MQTRAWEESTLLWLEANAEVCRLGSTSASLKLKGIGGETHKRWSVWFNSTISEEPYPHLTSQESSRDRGVPQGAW